MKKTFDQTYKAIDWANLSKQKQSLLVIQSYLNGNISSSIDRKAFIRSIKRHSKNVTGLLQTLDKLQDAAIEVYNVPEIKVFPSLIQVRKINEKRLNKV